MSWYSVMVEGWVLVFAGVWFLCLIHNVGLCILGAGWFTVPSWFDDTDEVGYQCGGNDWVAYCFKLVFVCMVVYSITWFWYCVFCWSYSDKLVWDNNFNMYTGVIHCCNDAQIPLWHYSASVLLMKYSMVVSLVCSGVPSTGVEVLLSLFNGWGWEAMSLMALMVSQMSFGNLFLECSRLGLFLSFCCTFSAVVWGLKVGFLHYLLSLVENSECIGMHCGWFGGDYPAVSGCKGAVLVDLMMHYLYMLIVAFFCGSLFAVLFLLLVGLFVISSFMVCMCVEVSAGLIGMMVLLFSALWSKVSSLWKDFVVQGFLLYVAHRFSGIYWLAGGRVGGFYDNFLNVLLLAIFFVAVCFALLFFWLCVVLCLAGSAQLWSFLQVSLAPFGFLMFAIWSIWSLCFGSCYGWVICNCTSFFSGYSKEKVFAVLCSVKEPIGYFFSFGYGMITLHSQILFGLDCCSCIVILFISFWYIFSESGFNIFLMFCVVLSCNWVVEPPSSELYSFVFFSWSILDLNTLYLPFYINTYGDE